MLGGPVVLRCQSDAIPPPTLLWRKDGRPLFGKPRLSISEDGSVLTVGGAIQTGVLGVDGVLTSLVWPGLWTLGRQRPGGGFRQVFVRSRQCCWQDGEELQPERLG